MFLCPILLNFEICSYGCFCYRTILMLLAFAVVPFIPSANIFFTVGFVIAERNLYISSIGFIGIVVLGIVVLFENESLRKVTGENYIQNSICNLAVV